MSACFNSEVNSLSSMQELKCLVTNLAVRSLFRFMNLVGLLLVGKTF